MLLLLLIALNNVESRSPGNISLHFDVPLCGYIAQPMRNGSEDMNTTNITVQWYEIEDGEYNGMPSYFKQGQRIDGESALTFLFLSSAQETDNICASITPQTQSNPTTYHWCITSDDPLNGNSTCCNWILPVPSQSVPTDSTYFWYQALSDTNTTYSPPYIFDVKYELCQIKENDLTLLYNDPLCITTLHEQLQFFL
eukprot:794317_1